MSADETSNVPIDLLRKESSVSASDYCLDDPLKFVQEISSASQNNLKTMWQKNYNEDEIHRNSSISSGERTTNLNNPSESKKSNLFSYFGFPEEDENIDTSNKNYDSIETNFVPDLVQKDISQSFSLLKLNRANEIWCPNSNNNVACPNEPDSFKKPMVFSNSFNINDDIPDARKSTLIKRNGIWSNFSKENWVNSLEQFSKLDGDLNKNFSPPKNLKIDSSPFWNTDFHGSQSMPENNSKTNWLQNPDNFLQKFENYNEFKNESIIDINSFTDSFSGEDLACQTAGESFDNSNLLSDPNYSYENYFLTNSQQGNSHQGYENCGLNYIIPNNQNLNYKQNYSSSLYGELPNDCKYISPNFSDYNKIHDSTSPYMPVNSSQNNPYSVYIQPHQNYPGLTSSPKKFIRPSFNYYDSNNQILLDSRINSQISSDKKVYPISNRVNDSPFATSKAALSNTHRISHGNLDIGSESSFTLQPQQHQGELFNNQIPGPQQIIFDPSDPSMIPNSPLSTNPFQCFEMDYNHHPSRNVVLLREGKKSQNNAIKNFRLSQLNEYIVGFARDQLGSRYIQQKLESATPAEKNEVFQYIEPHATKLMTDVFGNYVIQKFFEFGTQQHKDILIECLRGHVVEYATQMYGCRVIQKALETISPEAKIQIISELRPCVIKCVKDQNGNHVIQKCIECVDPSQLDFIITTFKGQVIQLSSHPYGCRVIQRILENCFPEQIEPIMNELHKGIDILVRDQYGNYVIQHILEHGSSQDKEKVISFLHGKVYILSIHKFASNVMEKAITHSNSKERYQMIEEVLNPPNENDSNSNLLLNMMKDQYANYVVQRMLDLAEEPQLKTLFNNIKPVQSSLRKFNYGKHIIMKLEKFNSSKLQENSSTNSTKSK